MNDVPKLLDLLKDWGPWGLIAILLYLLIFKSTDLKVFQSNFVRLFVWLGRAPRKLYIASDISSRLRRISASEAYKDLTNVDTIKIKWIDPKTDEKTFLDNQKMVVKMKYYANQDENFIYATKAYVSDGIVPQARYYLPDRVKKSIDLNLTRDIIKREKGLDTVKTFINDMLRDEFLKDAGLEPTYIKVKRIDLAGLLTFIFLKELKNLVDKIYPSRLNDSEIVAEATKFLDFLEAIVLRSVGAFVDLDFLEKCFRLHVLLLAKKEKIKKTTIPYLQAIETALKNGCTHIYIIAFEHCADEAIIIARKATKQYNLHQESKTYYHGTISGLASKLLFVHLSLVSRP